MEIDTHKGNAAAIIEAVTQLSNEKVIDVAHPNGGSDIPLIVLPEGRDVHSLKALLDEYADHPDRAEGTAKVTTLASFIAHANRTQLAESVIFADDNPQSPALVAVYDYNESENENDTTLGTPGFMRHRARYEFPKSDEWTAWTAASGRTFSMVEFAEFVEDHLVDVILPEEGQDSIKTFAARLELTLATPRQLMELSRSLKVNVESRVEQAQNLKSGESRFVFVTEQKDEAGQPIRVPGGFAISIPVFRGGAKYDVPVLLRYRVAGGKVTWSFSLHRTDLIIRRVITEAAEQAQKETGLPMFFGTPER